tara:strand:- start:28 stop:414 length:387 start_codon:yes stop_codon:yes gene_type:complete
VTHVVESVQEMEKFLEINFNMKPIKTGEFPHRHFKYIMYRVGHTLMDFLEPTSDAASMAKFLKENGPGVYHVAWEVKGIDRVYQALKGRGYKLREDKASTSPYGYKAFNIEPNNTQGVLFQLAEGELT